MEVGMGLEEEEGCLWFGDTLFHLQSLMIWNIHIWQTSTWNLCMFLKPLSSTVNFLCNDVNVTMKSQSTEKQPEVGLSVLPEMPSSSQTKRVHPSPKEPDCSWGHTELD